MLRSLCAVLFALLLAVPASPQTDSPDCGTQPVKLCPALPLVACDGSDATGSTTTPNYEGPITWHVNGSGASSWPTQTQYPNGCQVDSVKFYVRVHFNAPGVNDNPNSFQPVIKYTISAGTFNHCGFSGSCAPGGIAVQNPNQLPFPPDTQLQTAGLTTYDGTHKWTGSILNGLTLVQTRVDYLDNPPPVTTTYSEDEVWVNVWLH